MAAVAATAYLVWGVVTQGPSVYRGGLFWSDGNSVFAIAVTTFVASTVLSSVTITYAVSRGSSSLLLLLPAFHVFLIGLPLAGIVLGVVVAIAWGATRVQSAT